MALRIRLRRMGSTKRPFYRIVVAESSMPRDGRFVDIVGHYNPITDPAEIRVEEEKVYHWLRQGALPTDTVRSLLSTVGVWRKWGLLKRGVDPVLAIQVTVLIKRFLIWLSVKPNQSRGVWIRLKGKTWFLKRLPRKRAIRRRRRRRLPSRPRRPQPRLPLLRRQKKPLPHQNRGETSRTGPDVDRYKGTRRWNR